MNSAALLTMWVVLAAAQPDAAELPPDPATMAEVRRLAMTGSTLTVEQASRLQAAVDRNPDDLSTRVQLLGYYWRQQFASPSATEEHARHAMWIIRNRPASPAAGIPEAGLNHVSSPDAYAEARDAWLKQIEDHPGNAAILGNAAAFFTISDRAKAIELVTRAGQLDVDNPDWPKRLGQLHALDVLQRSRVDAEAANRALRAYEVALGKSPAGQRYYMLPDVAKMALYAGELEKAKKYATELLNGAVEAAPDWNYGNAVHHGNLVLGHVAFIEGDINASERHLLRAGKTPGSPQLNSFGPNMMLAKALIEAGRQEAVIEYLELCGKFWKRGPIRDWINVVREGGTPDFGANLRY